MFAERLELAARYEHFLATEGVVRGVIGPREPGRIWERHLVNSAIVTDLVPSSARVVDVGSGGGLPGIPMAIRRPDLRVDLVEPMARRADFLTEAVRTLELDGVRVLRGRAGDPTIVAKVAPADWVVARAVAPLTRLVEWCLPLLSRRGRLVAIKGERAADEVADAADTLQTWGLARPEARLLRLPGLPDTTWVVEVFRA